MRSDLNASRVWPKSHFDVRCQVIWFMCTDFESQIFCIDYWNDHLPIIYQSHGLDVV